MDVCLRVENHIVLDVNEPSTMVEIIVDGKTVIAREENLYLQHYLQIIFLLIGIH